MRDSNDPMYQEWVEQLIDSIHCPKCGRKAVRMQVKQNAYGVWVEPTYNCGTLGCPNSIHAKDQAWTLAIAG